MRALPLLFLLLLGLARAGDAATLEFWGFSRDGKYLAFEQYGIRDGSGFPYSEIYLVDVARNTLVAGANVVIQSEKAGPSAARQRALAQSQAVLRRYRIVRGNQGRFAGAVGKNYAAQRLEFSGAAATYTLELTTSDAPSQGNCLTDRPRLPELSLSSGRNERVLRRDTRLPASRACAYAYQVHSIFVLGSSLAVFVQVTRDGFEGPDLRWMVVTARL